MYWLRELGLRRLISGMRVQRRNVCKRDRGVVLLRSSQKRWAGLPDWMPKVHGRCALAAEYCRGSGVGVGADTGGCRMSSQLASSSVSDLCASFTTCAQIAASIVVCMPCACEGGTCVYVCVCVCCFLVSVFVCVVCLLNVSE
jgi:hypothetical protein